MWDFFAWALVVFAAVSTCFTVWLVDRGISFLGVHATRPGINDDSEATSFIAMLDEARESMTIYDVGDNGEGSLYNDRRAIDAVRGKLQVNPAFKLRCLFDCDDHMAFQQELESEPQVDIRIRSRSAPANEVHYKIIDGGAKAYLSRYDACSKQRRFRIVDCTGVPRRHRRFVADTVLGPFKEHFDKAFGTST